MTQINRRVFVTGSVVAAAAVTGGGLAARTALEPAGPASRHVATVVAHEGAFATVTGTAFTDAPRRLALKGFPIGWKLRRGDTVFIREGADSHFVEPLSAPVIGEVEGPLTRDDHHVSIGNTTITIQEATVIDHESSTAGRRHVAHCISNQNGLASACLAIRSV